MMTPQTAPSLIVDRPRLVFRPDARLGWALAPGGRVKVGWRDGVVQNIGDDGWRKNPDLGHKARSRIAIYGCSFTYGTGLADDETYPAQLQSRLEDTAVFNRGIGGHGSVQNYIQFRQDIRLCKPDIAVFGVLSDHRFRNVMHPHRMRQMQNLDWYRAGVEHVPVANVDRDGEFFVKYMPIWQPSLNGNGFADFLPNDHMLDAATFGVFEAILKMARSHRVKVVFALLDQLDPKFNAVFLSRFDCGLDISVPTDEEHSFLPHDVHPNPAANRLFAQRLTAPVRALLRACEGGGA